MGDGERVAERFRAKSREVAVGLHGVGRHEIHVAEAAMIAEDDARSVVEVKDHMVMRLFADGPCGGFRRPDFG